MGFFTSLCVTITSWEVIAKSKIFNFKGVTHLKHYYGLAETTFKERWRNHKTSFDVATYKNATDLSSYIWELCPNGISGTDVKVSWCIEQKSSKYQCGTRRCDLCLSEKVAIAMADKTSLLNKRTEVVTKCRHRNKFQYNNPKIGEKVKKKARKKGARVE